MKKTFLTLLLVTLIIPHLASDNMEKLIAKASQELTARTYRSFTYDWQIPKYDFEQSINARSAREISMVQVSAGPYQNSRF